jgi:Transcriptional regulators
MRRSNATTLKDVALAAGVAKMTASVVLNGARSGTQVSEATRARILEAAQRLGYRPNGVARGLSRRRMDALGVVALVNEGAGLNLYFLEIFNGILEAATHHGQSASVFGISSWWGEARHADLLRLCDGRVDGLIFLGPHRLDPTFIASVQQHTPLVAIHAEEAPPSLYNVDVDNEGGMYAATRHLIELGHRRIAHLAGSTSPALPEAGARERLAGYRRALEEAGLPFDPALVPEGYYVESSGLERTQRLLDAPGPLPTAFCCANDAIAVGCLEALRARGLRVPEDVSVTGFDGVLTSQVLTPPLTTVRQPLPELGRRAVELLLHQIHNASEGGEDTDDGPRDASTSESRTEVWPVELVIRGSTASPPARPASHRS